MSGSKESLQNENNVVPEHVQHEINQISGLIERDVISAGAAAMSLAEQHPDVLEVHLFNAYVLNRQRRFAETIRSLTAAKCICPNDRRVLFRIGAAQLQTGNLKAALRNFTDSARFGESVDARADFRAGQCEHRLGNPEAAVAFYEKALASEPDDIQVLTSLMFAYRECGALVKADRIAVRMKARFAGDRKARRQYLSVIHSFVFSRWLCLDNKADQWRAIASFRDKNGEAAFPWMPETFVMPDDFAALETVHDANLGCWFVKPAALYGGHGIRIINTPDDAPLVSGWVVQRKVREPILVRDRNTIIRVYVLFTSPNPIRAYLYREGMVRFAPGAHPDDDSHDLARHVASVDAFGWDDGLRRELIEAIDAPHPVWRLSRLLREFRSMGFDEALIARRLRALVTGFVRVILSTGLLREQAANGMRFAYGPKIIGLDVMVDRDHMPWLIEMEHCPGPRTMLAASNGRILDDLINMTVFPLLDPSKNPEVEDKHFSDTTIAEARIAEIEFARRGGFDPIVLDCAG